MVRTRLLAAVSLVALLAGCGDSEAPSPTRLSDWSLARVWAESDQRHEGVDEFGGLFEIGAELVAVARHRLDLWFVISRDQLVDGARVSARRIEPTFNESSWVGGRGPLAARAVSMAAMKTLPVEVVGLGGWSDGQFALLDRRQRVLWSGRLLAGPGGGVRAITFDRATVLPGGDHSGLDEADPRDRGAGVRALAVLPEARDGVDLAVLEAAPAVGTPWRLHRLDRTGATVKRPLLLPRGERDPEVRALAAWEDGYVALALGMQRYSSSPDGHLLAGERIPPPVVERTTIEWETLGRGAAGRLYLAGRPGMIVSTGEDPPRLIELAWR